MEFEGDEVFWSLQDNYTFEMLLQDAARYWDLAPHDVSASRAAPTRTSLTHAAIRGGGGRTARSPTISFDAHPTHPLPLSPACVAQSVLVDERGAIWPNDAFVKLELQRNAAARIGLKIKPVAVSVDEDVEL